MVTGLTLAQLLAYTAGMINEASGAGPHDDAALGARVRGWTATHRIGPADDVHSYSGPGYWLAGYAIEQAGRAPYADVVRGRVDGVQALPATAVAALLTPRVPIPGDACRYAYGLSACTRGGIRTVSHSGFRVGSGSVITMPPDSQAAVIVLADRNGGILARTADAALQQLVGLAPDTGGAATATRPAASLATPAPRAAWIGTYANGPDTLRLLRHGDRLVYRSGMQESATRLDGPDAILMLAADGTPEQRFQRIAGVRSRRPYLHDGPTAFARLAPIGAGR